jgi:hypothetical protein
MRSWNATASVFMSHGNVRSEKRSGTPHLAMRAENHQSATVSRARDRRHRVELTLQGPMDADRAVASVPFQRI